MKRFVAISVALVFVLLNMGGCEHEKKMNNNLKESNIESNEAVEFEKELFDTSEFKCLSCFDEPEVSFWLDKCGEYYVYINEWQEYRQLEGLEQYLEYHVQIEPTSTVIDGSTCTIAVYTQSGKSDTEIITYHFNKDIKLTQVYNVKLDTMIDGEPNYFMITMLDENHGLFICFANYNNLEGKCWPLFRYETIDGGKTWNKIETLYFDPTGRYHCDIAKFATNEVGIISCTRDWYGCTYLTKDGGLTWEHIRNVHVPYDDITKIGYSRFYNFEKRDEKYILTAEIDLCSNLNENEQLDFSVYIFYESTDLINWNIRAP